MKKKTLSVNGREVEFNGERNLLEVVRKANIEIPTFCYHSELSVYGACRLCLVDVEGKGIVSSCSIIPEEGMKINTHTKEIRDIRKITMELLLANHDQDCFTCAKSASCKLREIADKLGVDKVRFKKTNKEMPLDLSSHAISRDPNKCILCGDCVRACEEIQGIGVIDFTHRGSEVVVSPAFGKEIGKGECVDCGQCARVCPTGAIIPKSEIEDVWNEIYNDKKFVIAQIAPAVRVAIGESFGYQEGISLTGQIVAALKLMGFDKVFDTSFAADLTVIEESNEFLKRYSEGKNLPIITSCCPGWVKYAEQYYPEFLDNLSSCKSPQQMFGSIAKSYLAEKYEIDPKNISVVSIMPCTAKKFEARRPEFEKNGIKEVDYVITTQELVDMIKESGINFNKLEPDSLDLPLGFKTGAGIIFGNSGGVSEAVLRYTCEKVNGVKLTNCNFNEVRGVDSTREATVLLNGNEVKIAIVSGLKNAKTLLDKIKSGEAKYDMIEVMACPGGCIGGAGQPVSFEESIKQKRTEALYNTDKMLQLHKSQDNPYIKSLYEEFLGEINGHKAHDLLHTHYANRKRLFESEISLIKANNSQKLEVKVCVGTNCYLKNSQTVLQRLLDHLEERNLVHLVDVKATFCMEKCEKSPNILVGEEIVTSANFEKVISNIEDKLVLIANSN
ncbi:MAG: ferredoxin [Ignavibacteriae bacterium]|nr:ferredoxin [Ignavibacteriota bacterium]